MKLSSPPWAALALILLPGALSAAQAARPLDHEAYDRWSEVRSEVLAPGGRHAAWVVEPEAAPSRLVVHDLDADASLVLPRGRSPRFSADGRWLFATVDAHRVRDPLARTLTDPEAAREGRDGVADVDGEAGGAVLAGDTLVVVDLARAFAPAGSGVKRVPGGRGAAAPHADGRWLGYFLPRRDDDGSEGLGRTLVVLDLDAGRESRIPDVEQFRFSDDGSRLWYVTGGDRSTLWVTRPAGGRGHRVLSSPGRIRHLVLTEDGERAAVLVREGERDVRVDRWSLWRADPDGAARLAGPEEGLPDGRALSDGLGVRFSPDGTRLFFGTHATEPEPGARDPEAERVRVDVWSWTDAQLQPQQILRTRQERERAYLATVPWTGGPVVQLEDEALPDVTVAAEGDGAVALGVTDLPYRRVASWDGRYVDAYRIDVATGERERVLEAVRGHVSLSPGGRWIAWWDGNARAWKALDVHRGGEVVLTAALPHPVHDERDDRPEPPDAWGLAGWTAGDARALVYDRYDVWAVDPTGAVDPVDVTAGLGRREGVRLRYQDVDEGEAVPWDEPALLSAFSERDRRGGFYRARLADAVEPTRLLLSDHHWGAPATARGTDRMLVTRESFREFPDVWLADADFAEPRRLSDANPQQGDYRWGDAQLVSWTSANGIPLEGLLYTPEGFDPARRYPMIVTFYERSSDELNRYHVPAADGSSINRSVYTSRGYLVFVPDIPYQVGHPGRSAVEAVVPGVEALVARGFVDPDRIGLQGHSWGGYQVAYLVTQTDLFAAAEAGAPVVNMTSAYGGIRWGSGASRMFQYEEGQSRIGTTLWEGLDLYLENSPLFAADRIQTPLLMLHNDEDTAVPFEQGIEMFVALRRLGKPAWLLNYNGEEHGLRREANRRDWAVRMQQFFDHYLLGEAPPVWMVEGVPASRKGETLGLDLVEDAPSVVADSVRVDRRGGGR